MLKSVQKSKHTCHILSYIYLIVPYPFLLNLLGSTIPRPRSIQIIQGKSSYVSTPLTGAPCLPGAKIDPDWTSRKIHALLESNGTKSYSLSYDSFSEFNLKPRQISYDQPFFIHQSLWNVEPFLLATSLWRSSWADVANNRLSSHLRSTRPTIKSSSSSSSMKRLWKIIAFNR